MKKKLPLILVVLSIIIVTILVIFLNSTKISLFDSWFYAETAERMNPTLTLIMRFVTESGGAIAIAVICLSLFLFTKTRRRWAIPVSLTVMISAVLNLFLKLTFMRERPDIQRLIEEDNYSFPSGHAMNNMAFYMMLLLLTWKYVDNKILKWALSILYLIMPLVIGFSRIYLGVHYATDIIAGWLLGFCVALIIYTILNRKKGNVWL